MSGNSPSAGNPAAAENSTHLVSAFETPDLGAVSMRIGDLNGDGAPDLLFVQTLTPVKPGTREILCNTREITCLTATTISGEVIWQYGEPSVTNGGGPGYDLPVQVYDWDNDGHNEVLFIRQAVYGELYPGDPPEYRGRARYYEGTATMVVLNGRTGEEKTSFPMPAPADDSIVFADLTGRGWRGDFIVKDPCENIYGVSHTGELLWHWHGGTWPIPGHNLAQEAKISIDDPQGETGHFPAIADIDGDGCDEMFIGFTLIDHDGSVIWRKDAGGEHQDASYVVRMADGRWRLLFGNGGVHCLDADGTELWHNPLMFNEAQHVVAGKFRDDSEMQVAVIDRGAPRTPDGKPAWLYLFDVETGKEFWRREQLPGGWCAACMDIRWRGVGGLKEIVVSQRGHRDGSAGSPVAIYDGQGDIVTEIDVSARMLAGSEHVTAPIHDNYGCCCADVWGDSREELIVYGRNGVFILANPRPLAIATLYNHTGYRGM